MRLVSEVVDNSVVAVPAKLGERDVSSGDGGSEEWISPTDSDRLIHIN